MSSKPGASSGGTPPQIQPVPKEDFKADKRPKKFRYDRVDGIPRLPGPLTENEFYSQWADQTRLNGFPLVEDQDFIVGHCLDDGNCYWSAIAVLIYGSDQYWPWVKAQHYLWISQVLENEAHPRYALYRRLLESILHAKNARRQKAFSPEPPLSPTAFNVMGLPNAWTSTDITPITADLYGISLVMFLMDQSDVNKPDKFNPVLVKGHPNAPSRFMRFMNNNHFEPMRPNVPRPSEFRYPLINSETTKNFPHANKNSKAKQPHQNPWRTGGQPHGRDGIDEELFPRPVLPLPSEADLAFVIGQQAIERAFTREPGWLPPINTAQVELAKRDITRIFEGARAVYHSWTEPSLLLECARRQIAPAANNPGRTVLIEALLAHDRGVATRLVEKTNAAGPPVVPPTPRGLEKQLSPQTGVKQPTLKPEGTIPTPKTGGVQPPSKTGGIRPAPQPPKPKAPTIPPTPGSMPGPRAPGPRPQTPGSSPTPGPPIGPHYGPPTTGGASPASPQPKRNYGALRKGDLLAEVRKRGLVATSTDTAARVRWILEADDLRRAREGEEKGDEIEDSEGGEEGDDVGGQGEGKEGGDTEPEDKESKGNEPKSDGSTDEGSKDQEPEGKGNGKNGKRPAPADEDGNDEVEDPQHKPKRKRKQTKK